MPTPYLLLDVDGVLIPFPDPTGHRPTTHRSHKVVPTGYDPDQPVTIWLNPDHGPMIRLLLDTGLVTAAWATSWHDDGNRLIGSKLGLPELPVTPLGRPNITTSRPNGYLWKRDPVVAWIGSQPTAWIDDDFTDEDHAWADERTAAGTPTLLVQPSPRIGILPEHLARVRSWAAAAAQVGVDRCSMDESSARTKSARRRLAGRASPSSLHRGSVG